MSQRDMFPSAISRYLVSDQNNGPIATVNGWLFPSAISRYLVSDVRARDPTRSRAHRFHPLYRGTWYLTLSPALWVSCGASFHPLYRGTWYLTSSFDYSKDGDLAGFPSAISRYLVSDLYGRTTTEPLYGFHPLYRGTWFPTYQKNTPSDQRRRKRFTHPPSNRSHSHICFLKSR